MATAGSSWSNRLLNLGLLLAVGALLLLVYSVIAGALRPEAEPVRAENPAGLVSDIIQVEVLNGCGISGLAGDVRLFLRSAGFDVVGVGDYTSFDVDESFVIDRTGNAETARQVARALGLPEARVRTDVDPDLFLDASVVIGRDYATLPPFAEAD